MKRFLLIQTAFLGDVVLATPVISALKNRYPAAQIDVLVRKGNESLLDNHPEINDVFTLNKKAGKWKEIIRLIRIFRSKNYDEIINLQRFASSGFIACFSKATCVSGFQKNPFSFLYTHAYPHTIGDGTHEIERNLRCISRHVSTSCERPRLHPATADWQKIEPLTTDAFVCLAPASIWFTKQLPEQKWAELARQLLKRGLKVYLIGGPDDHALNKRIAEQVESEQCINLAGELSLLQSAALLSKAVHNFVNDSGPMHLASAMNAPVTAFFCSTIPAFGFGPVSDTSFVEETKHSLECRPCGLHGFKHCPKGHFQCGDIDLTSLGVWTMLA